MIIGATRCRGLTPYHLIYCIRVKSMFCVCQKNFRVLLQCIIRHDNVKLLQSINDNILGVTCSFLSLVGVLPCVDTFSVAVYVTVVTFDVY